MIGPSGTYCTAASAIPALAGQKRQRTEEDDGKAAAGGESVAAEEAAVAAEEIPTYVPGMRVPIVVSCL